MLRPNQKNWKEFTAWLKQHEKIDTSIVNEKCGVEIVGTKLNKTKTLTRGLPREFLQRRYIENNLCPRLRYNEKKRFLVRALMNC